MLAGLVVVGGVGLLGSGGDVGLLGGGGDVVLGAHSSAALSSFFQCFNRWGVVTEKIDWRILGLNCFINELETNKLIE